MFLLHSLIGFMVEWLQFHPVTVRGTGSNPVGTAKRVICVVTSGVISATTLLSGSSSVGRARSFQVRGRRFEPCLPLKGCVGTQEYVMNIYPQIASLAQLVELLFCKQVVVGSSPTGGSNKGN
jgi:hypothetical protein